MPVNQELRSDLEAKSLEELEGILKLYGPLHNQTDTVNRKRMIRAIEIAMYQASNLNSQAETKDLNPGCTGHHAGEEHPQEEDHREADEAAGGGSGQRGGRVARTRGYRPEKWSITDWNTAM